MRKKDREITDLQQKLEIVDACRVIRLGLYDPDTCEVYIVPMNYGYTFEEGTLTFYMHGAAEGYKYEIMSRNPKAGFELECEVQPFEGPTACLYGMSFKSLVGHGEITFIDTPAEKIEAMKLLMKCQTEKDFEFNERLLTIVRMFKLTVTDFTGKYRPVPPALIK